MTFNGDADKFPENLLSDWSYGDDTVEERVQVDFPDIPIERNHIYSKPGIYNINIKLYNPYDTEKFTIEVSTKFNLILNCHRRLFYLLFYLPLVANNNLRDAFLE